MNSRWDRTIERYGAILFTGVLLLGLLHFLFPEYTWGQGRRSYFYLTNSLSLAAWLTSMAVFVASVFSSWIALGERDERQRLGWMSGAILLLLVSFCIITRLPSRAGLFITPGKVDPLRLLGLPAHILAAALVALIVYGRFILAHCATVRARRLTWFWLFLWSVAAGTIFLPFRPHSHVTRMVLDFVRGESLLGGAIALLTVLAMVTVTRATNESLVRLRQPPESPLLPAGVSYALLLLGIAMTSGVLISFEVVLFHTLLILRDYVSANSAISIALLGIATGALIGFFATTRAPRAALGTAAGLLPCFLVLALGAAGLATTSPFLAAVLLTLPFACGAVVITLGLSLAPSHLAYAADLVGAGLGAAGVNFLIGGLREENGFVFLAAVAGLAAACFTPLIAASRKRRLLWAGATVGIALVAVAGTWGAAVTDTFNVTRWKILSRWPAARVSYSRSTVVGRIDIIRKDPRHRFLKTMENGRVIDTIRPFPVDAYEIDPRLPHTMISNPDVLIIGSAAEGIVKTARNLGRSVVAVEINPAVVDLITGDIASFARRPYDGVEVVVMDGRTYLEQTDRTFDFITLMNAHGAAGGLAGRVAAPEYLHTVEAFDAYLAHLNERGFLVMEEPANKPAKEAPIWKSLVTARQALLNLGVRRPEDHFLVFRWTTRTNNYYQILVKKTGVTEQDVTNFRRWLADCTDQKVLSRRVGRRLGPIVSTTEALYIPGDTFDNVFARAIRGELDQRMVRDYNLTPTLDRQPFPFDVNPSRPGLRHAYSFTLALALLLVPAVWFAARRGVTKHGTTGPLTSIAVLTGFAYLLVEIVLMQSYEIYLGSPILSVSLVLGTLLVFSGIGSMSSGRTGAAGAAGCVAGIAILLALFWSTAPALFAATARHPMWQRATLAVVSLAPLALLMGVPFAFALRTGSDRLGPGAAAFLFAVNGIAGAIAVPLALDLTTGYGFPGATMVALAAYTLVAFALFSLNRPRLRRFANALSFLAIVGLLTMPWIDRALFRPGPRTSRETYDVFAIRYGRSRFDRDKLVRGRSEKREKFAWYVWLLRGNGRVILVDTGFANERQANVWHVRGFEPSDRRLRALGLTPDQVTDVILTHLHRDHCANLAPYHNATVWVQKAELDYAHATVNPARPYRKGIALADLITIESLRQQRRLHVLDGIAQPFPGIRLEPGGGHTPGSQQVIVETEIGPVVLASDAAYLYENILRHRAIGGTRAVRDNLATLRRMRHEAASATLVLPGHDPRVLRRFPRVAPGIVKIEPR